jgi:hypothetical protein
VLDAFREIVTLDFEFAVTSGDRPEPVCLVAHELRSRRQFRIWRDQFGPTPPYATGPDVLFVGYYVSAEFGCYRVLGWPMPERILDLFCEFRARTNGLDTPAGSSLLGALAYFGLDGIGATEKDEMRELVLRGGPWSEAERTSLLDYCKSDVAALERLLPAMLPGIDVPRALLRARYIAAASAMEHAGTPIDVPMLELLRARWTDIQDQLIADIDTDYGVFVGRTFKADLFANWLARPGIAWPLLESGCLDLSDDAFRQQARVYPSISPLRELRSSLSDLRLNDLAVGRDGRNRTILSAFRSRTGRNQPSNGELFKQCVLAVQYGMEAESLALRIGQPPIVARNLLRAHRQTYRRFWDWSDAAVDQAMLTGLLYTVFGWPIRIGERSNPRSLRNFPMQANGAEMLRIACCLATERGIEVCAPIHDAVLICAPLDRLEADIAAMRALWRKPHASSWLDLSWRRT